MCFWFDSALARGFNGRGRNVMGIVVNMIIRMETIELYDVMKKLLAAICWLIIVKTNPPAS